MDSEGEIEKPTEEQIAKRKQAASELLSEFSSPEQKEEGVRAVKKMVTTPRKVKPVLTFDKELYRKYVAEKEKREEEKRKQKQEEQWREEAEQFGEGQEEQTKKERIQFLRKFYKAEGTPIPSGFFGSEDAEPEPEPEVRTPPLKAINPFGPGFPTGPTRKKLRMPL